MSGSVYGIECHPWEPDLCPRWVLGKGACSPPPPPAPRPDRPDQHTCWSIKRSGRTSHLGQLSQRSAVVTASKNIQCRGHTAVSGSPRTDFIDSFTAHASGSRTSGSMHRSRSPILPSGSSVQYDAETHYRGREHQVAATSGQRKGQGSKVTEE